MIPIRDVIPSRSRPVVTLGLMAVNATVFLAGLAASPTPLELQLTWGLIPATVAPQQLLSSLFIHDGWIHLIGNLWALWMFGDNVEDRLGRLPFLAFYLLVGTLAGLTVVLAAPALLAPIVGANGAIAGVIGAYFTLYPRSKILVLTPVLWSVDLVEVPALAFAGFWLAAQLILGLGRGIEPISGLLLLSHGVALAAGAGLMWSLRHRRSERYWWERRR